jgi:hypothetical protein
MLHFHREDQFVADDEPSRFLFEAGENFVLTDGDNNGFRTFWRLFGVDS